MEGTKIWVIYGLIDPETGRVFYVGMSNNPTKRVYQHHYAVQSPAFHMCREIERKGLKVGHCIFGDFTIKREAEFLERELSRLLPQLYNEHGYREGRKLWQTVKRVLGHGLPEV